MFNSKVNVSLNDCGVEVFIIYLSLEKRETLGL